MACRSVGEKKPTSGAKAQCCADTIGTAEAVPFPTTGGHPRGLGSLGKGSTLVGPSACREERLQPLRFAFAHRTVRCGRINARCLRHYNCGYASAHETESLDLDIWIGLRRVCARRQGRFRQPGSRDDGRDSRGRRRILRGLGTATTPRSGPPALICSANATRHLECHHTS